MNPSSDRNIILQERDYRILDFLRSQGFATFGQLQGLFFCGKKSCSLRLRSLEVNNYVRATTSSEFFKGTGIKYSPLLMGLNIHPLTKIYTLSSVFRRQVSETNRLLKYDLCLHQLMLNDVRINLDHHITGYRLVLNDPQLKTWSIIDPGRRHEFTPDLSYESKNYSIAIELERTVKSLRRYMDRFGYYQSSVYTHVLYVYTAESHLATLLKYAGNSRRFAFAHYLKPNEVFSNVWGHMEINDWIKKLSSVS